MNHTFARKLSFIAQKFRKEPLQETFDEILRTQHLSRDELNHLQFGRLSNVVRFAYEHSKFYRDFYSAVASDITNFKSLDDLKKLPIIYKKTIQHNYRNMECENPRPFTIASTSGSSGDPLLLKRDNVSWAYLHANMFRLHTWHGIPAGAKYVNVMGISPRTSKHISAKIKELLFNRINLVAVDMSEGELIKICNRMLSFKPTYIYGYPSAIADLANFITNSDYRDRLDFITNVICHGEELENNFIDSISKAFNVSVINQYGSAEVGMVAMQCEKGNLHVPIESIVVEEVDGELVLTDLHNYVCPMIRYNIGDVASIISDPCPCGRKLPIMKDLQGKRRAIIKTPDGKRVHTVFFNSLFKDLFSRGYKIERYQIIQNDNVNFDINLILNQSITPGLESTIQKEIINRFGSQVNFKINQVNQLRKLKSGKFAAFIKDCQ